MRAHPVWLLLLCPLAAACGSGGRTDLSADGARIELGEYLIMNNQWGKALAVGPHAQTIFLREEEAGPVFGWDWSWVSTRVAAYPSVFLGRSPFDPLSTTDRLPLRVGGREITARFQVTTEATGSWNSSFDLYVTSSPTTPRGSLTHEIMVWTDGHGMTPAGERVGELTVGGVGWDLYYTPDLVLSAYGFTDHFSYSAYVAREPVRSGPLDLGAFLADLVGRGYVPADGWLSTVCFGNEVVLGAGRTEVSGYAIEIE